MVLRQLPIHIFSQQYRLVASPPSPLVLPVRTLPGSCIYLTVHAEFLVPLLPLISIMKLRAGREGFLFFILPVGVKHLCTFSYFLAFTHRDGSIGRLPVTSHFLQISSPSTFFLIILDNVTSAQVLFHP